MSSTSVISAGAFPDSPTPQLQNLTFSQWTGVQQLLFFPKTHFFAARQPAHLSPCHGKARPQLLLVLLPSQKCLVGSQYTVPALFNVAEARWCAMKGGYSLPSLMAHIWRGLGNRDESPEFDAVERGFLWGFFLRWLQTTDSLYTRF